MQLRLRPLLFAASALFAVNQASAQFIELVTEAPVTLQAVITTSTPTSTETERRTVISNSRLSHQQILQDIVETTDPGWSLVAVRYLPADLAHVDAGFDLYAVNGEQRNKVNLEKFAIRALKSVAKYKERHIGQYVLSSSGSVTNHVAVDFRPVFALGDGTASPTSSLSDGFATVAFSTRDGLGDQEVFFYLLNSVRVTTRGGLRLDTEQDALISLTINVGSPRLTPATNYTDTIAVPPTALSGVDSL